MVRFPFYARLALTLFAIALIFAFMWVGKSVLVPLFFSFLVAILLHPLVKFFEKKRFPRALAAVTALLIFMILLGGLFYFFSHQVVRLSRDLPSLQAKVTDKWEQIQDWISDKYHITNTQQVAYVNKSATGILNSADEFRGNHIYRHRRNTDTYDILFHIYFFYSSISSAAHALCGRAIRS